MIVLQHHVEQRATDLSATDARPSGAQNRVQYVEGGVGRFKVGGVGGVFDEVQRPSVVFGCGLERHQLIMPTPDEMNRCVDPVEFFDRNSLGAERHEPVHCLLYVFHCGLAQLYPSNSLDLVHQSTYHAISRLMPVPTRLAARTHECRFETDDGAFIYIRHYGPIGRDLVS